MSSADPIQALRAREQAVLEDVWRIQQAIASLELLVAGDVGSMTTSAMDEWPPPSAKTLMLRLLLEADRDWAVNEVVDTYRDRHIEFKVKDPANALRVAFCEANRAGQVFRTAVGRYKAAKWHRSEPSPLEVEKVQLSGYRCLRCGHEWLPRTDRAPKVCPNPKCKSPYWDRPRTRENYLEQSLMAARHRRAIDNSAFITDALMAFGENR